MPEYLNIPVEFSGFQDRAEFGGDDFDSNPDKAEIRPYQYEWRHGQDEGFCNRNRDSLRR
jgi:hypothetical protein